MKNKLQYRVKTEKEFIDEFGPKWRDCLLFKFVGGMDHLLGQHIDPTSVKYDSKGNVRLMELEETSIGRPAKWALSMDMLVSVRKEKIEAIMKRYKDRYKLHNKAS